MRKLEYNIEISVPRFPWRALPMFCIKFNLSSSEVSTLFHIHRFIFHQIDQASSTPLHSITSLNTWKFTPPKTKHTHTHTHTNTHRLTSKRNSPKKLKSRLQRICQRSYKQKRRACTKNRAGYKCAQSSRRQREVKFWQITFKREILWEKPWRWRSWTSWTSSSFCEFHYLLHQQVWE
jgi:hypothetical protein